MLDADLAELYQVPTKVLNQAVKQNKDRFPPRLHASTDSRGVCCFKVTNCDLRKRPGTPYSSDFDLENGALSKENT